MTIKEFLKKEIEKSKSSVEYCENDLRERKQKLLMFEQLEAQLNEK